MLHPSAGAIDVRKRLGLLIRTRQVGFQTGHNADRVGLGEVSRREADLGAGTPSSAGGYDLLKGAVMVTVSGRLPSYSVQIVRWREPTWFPACYLRMWSTDKSAFIRLVVAVGHGHGKALPRVS